MISRSICSDGFGHDEDSSLWFLTRVKSVLLEGGGLLQTRHRDAQTDSGAHSWGDA